MMKALLSTVVVAMVLVLVGAVNVNSEGLPPTEQNLGEVNILNVACGYVFDLAKAQNINVTHCRQAGPITEIDNVAEVKVKVITAVDSFTAELHFRKSLWWPSVGEVVGP